MEIKDRNRAKDFSRKVHNKSEDLFFSIIQKLPEKLIPHRLMNWMNKYLDKRIRALKQENIKITWRNMYLQNSLTEIHNRQQDTKEAPPDD